MSMASCREELTAMERTSMTRMRVWAAPMLVIKEERSTFEGATVGVDGDRHTAGPSGVIRICGFVKSLRKTKKGLVSFN